MPTLPDWPTEDESRGLADLLRGGDATAPRELVAAFLEPLTTFLHRKFPAADTHLCLTAAEDAVMKVAAGTDRYDPARGELGAFLRLVAAGDLRNLVAGERRRSRGIPLESVAEPAAAGNNVTDDSSSTSWDDPRLAAEIAAFDPGEKLTLDLMRRGVRGTAAFAQAVGLTAATPDALAAAVKRIKDRLKKRLARAVGGER